MWVRLDFHTGKRITATAAQTVCLFTVSRKWNMALSLMMKYCMYAKCLICFHSSNNILFTWLSSEMVCTIYRLKEIFLQKILQMTVVGIPRMSFLGVDLFQFRMLPWFDWTAAVWFVVGQGFYLRRSNLYSQGCHTSICKTPSNAGPLYVRDYAELHHWFWFMKPKTELQQPQKKLPYFTRKSDVFLYTYKVASLLSSN